MKVPVTWEDAQSLPILADDELELVAGLTMQKVYEVYRDRGGRALVTILHGKLVSESLEKSFQSF